MTTTEPVRFAAPAYEGDAGTTAILAGILGVVYSIAFLGGVVAGWAPQLGIIVASIALIVGALLSVAVLVAVYRRLQGEAATVGLSGWCWWPQAPPARSPTVASTSRMRSIHRRATCSARPSSRTRSTHEG